MAQDNPPDPAQTETSDCRASDYRDADSFQIEAQGHSFTFYPAGSDRLEALIDHIDGAQQTLEAFYYLFQEDQAGSQVRDALVAAAKRGVTVYLIVDDFGNDAPLEFFEPIVEAGGRFEVFSSSWNVRYLIRNHQKYAIADGVRVIAGGFNVSDHYFDPPEKNGWCDLGVAIEGPVVERFSVWFGQISDWIEGSGPELRNLRRLLRDWDPGEGPVKLLLGGPSIRTKNWAYVLKEDLAHADRLDLVSAYFTPPRSVRQLLARASRRGKARMIMAGKSDLDGTISAARLLYKNLLKSGAKIFEFQPCKLHMKLFVIDNLSYFGSANMDSRSLRINVEIMIRVEDEALASRLRDLIDHMEAASTPITDQWYARHSGPFARLGWRWAHIIAILDYWIARRLNR